MPNFEFCKILKFFKNICCSCNTVVDTTMPAPEGAIDDFFVDFDHKDDTWMGG